MTQKQGRQRDTILVGLERFRQASGTSLSLTHFLTFLYVCENEGLSMSELAVAARLSVATASRSIRGLARREDASGLPPHAGLVEIKHAGPQKNSRTLVLTAKGRMLRDALDRAILLAIPIRSKHRPEAQNGAGPLVVEGDQFG